VNAFDDYVARKEAEAARAVLSPFVTEIDQPPADVTPIGNAWTRRMFDDLLLGCAARAFECPSL